MISLDDLSDLLQETPVIASIHPVSTCYLPSDVSVYDTAAELVWSLDAPETSLPESALILHADPVYAVRFPRVRVAHDPFTPQLNTVLFERFDEITAHILTHSQISDWITEKSGRSEIITLMLIDGLSYRDVKRWLDAHPDAEADLTPCLVDGPTLTEIAFPQVLGDTPPALRLFDRGYRRRLGFTYWSRKDNQLTDVLFRTISDVNAVGDFSTVLAKLRRDLQTRSDQRFYIQIVRTGLDGYVHHQKRKPPVMTIVNTIMDEVLALADLFREVHRTAYICMTADHGILWRDEFEPQIVGRAPAGANPRSCDWSDLYYQEESGRRFAIAGREIYCLGYPKLRRALRIDEQGVHGGISFQESIVPFLTMRVGDIC